MTARSAGQADHAAIAEMLDAAAQSAKAAPLFPGPHPTTLGDAYRIQEHVIGLRTSRGDAFAGVKVGLTRREKWAVCGADDVIVGILTRSMLHQGEVDIALDSLIAPMVEPEIAFRLSRSIDGPISFEEARDAIDAMAAAIEVIDTRVAGDGFDLFQIIADNSNCAGAVLGSWSEPHERLDELVGRLEVDGETVATGHSSTVSGHPLWSVCAAARLATRQGRRLEAGTIVMSGSLAPARRVHRGQRVTCRVTACAPACLRLV